MAVRKEEERYNLEHFQQKRKTEHFEKGISGTHKYIFKEKRPALVVFFGTLAGLASILFGAGYILQYLFDSTFNLFTPALKAFIGFMGTSFTWLTGYVLHRKKKLHRRFTSALMAMPLCLNYVIIYLPVSVYEYNMTYFVLGYILMTLNTLLLLVLALYSEDMTAAVLTLAGIILGPLLMHNEDIPIYYYLFQWIFVPVTFWIIRRSKL